MIWLLGRRLSVKWKIVDTRELSHRARYCIEIKTLNDRIPKEGLFLPWFLGKLLIPNWMNLQLSSLLATAQKIAELPYALFSLCWMLYPLYDTLVCAVCSMFDWSVSLQVSFSFDFNARTCLRTTRMILFSILYILSSLIAFTDRNCNMWLNG